MNTENRILTEGINAKSKISRRHAIKIAAIAGFSLAGGRHLIPSLFSAPSDGNSKRNDLLDFVGPYKKWGNEHLTDFLYRLNQSQQELILNSLGRKPEDKDYRYDVVDVKKSIRFIASNTFTYPFKNASDYYYHDEIVRWTAKDSGVDAAYIEEAPTFLLERKIFEAIFKKTWDTLDVDQRKKLLQESDKENKILNKATIAAGSAAGALAALSATVSSMGFGFYILLSKVICAAAGILGVTLPFAAYVTASSTFAILTGPIGWAGMGILALGSALYAGRANPAKTAAIIIQIHMLKVEALEQAKELDTVMRNLSRRY